MAKVGDIVLFNMNQDTANEWNEQVAADVFKRAVLGEEYPAVVQKVFDDGLLLLKVWPIGNGALQLLNVQEGTVPGTWRILK